MDDSDKSASTVNACAAIVAGIGWTWVAALLATRDHDVLFYHVIPTAPAGWGFLALSTSRLLWAAAAGAALAAACWHAGKGERTAIAGPTRWLLTSYAIGLLDVLRAAGLSIPRTFFEALWLSLITGVAVDQIVRRISVPPRVQRSVSALPWLAIVWLLATAAGGWWYYQSQQAYDNFLLGYSDFGVIAIRVANTWSGYGFLKETPSLPPFWDHFNPALALLVPLWGLWPDPRLFLLVQAVCLALPAPIAYGLARQFGAARPTAAMWAAGYLVFPAVGQLNLSYSYGFHTITLALPLFFALIFALARGWLVGAAAVAILACCVEEQVPVVLACVTGVLALLAWLNRDPKGRLGRWTTATRPLSQRLPWWVWLSITAVLVLAFLLIYRFADFSQFQTSKFAHLGSSPLEVVLSPIWRPSEFWGTVIRFRTAFFLLALAVPFGLRPLVRGWPMLLSLLVPLGVLIAWGLPAATSVAFQYTTTLIPILFLAALTGACVGTERPDGLGEHALEPSKRAALRASGACVLAAGVTASALFGALPWSNSTLTLMRQMTYGANPELDIAALRAVGSEGNVTIHKIIERVKSDDASAVATGRIATHLLGIRRLETVDLAKDRWQALQAEAGPDRSAIEIFDWIILDLHESFQQSHEEIQFILDKARKAGYRLVQADHGVLLLARPFNRPRT